MKKVLVCGGRDYSDWRHVWRVLDGLCDLDDEMYVIEGGASGADEAAMRWRLAHAVSGATYTPDWKTHGRAAGPKRNQQMLDENPDLQLVLAFPGGSGTADMVRRAEKAGVKVVRCMPGDMSEPDLTMSVSMPP